MKYTKLLLSLGLITLSVTVALGANKIGQSSFQTLKISKGVRGTAMGDAYVALVNDVSSVYWNPAGLVKITQGQGQLLISRINMPADISYHTIAYGRNLGFGSIGMNVDFLKTDKMDVVTVDGKTGETFTASEMIIGFSFAQAIIDNFSYGFTLKYLRDDFADKDQTAFSGDMGVRYRTDFRGLTLGIVVKNIGPDTKFDGSYTNQLTAQAGGKAVENTKFGDAPQPSTFQFALAATANEMFGMNFEGQDIAFSVQLESPSDRPERVAFGAEYNFQQMLFLRSGYKFNAGEEGFTFGLGVNYQVGKLGYAFDYAYLQFGDFHTADNNDGLLSQPHRFSLKLAF